MQIMKPFRYCIYVRRHNQQLFECVGSFGIDLIADYLNDEVRSRLRRILSFSQAHIEDYEANPL